MAIICCNFAALSSAWLFYAWRGHAARLERQHQTLRNRVASVRRGTANRVG